MRGNSGPLHSVLAVSHNTSGIRYATEFGKADAISNFIKFRLPNQSKKLVQPAAVFAQRWLRRDKACSSAFEE
jgi:hypothetical protein